MITIAIAILAFLAVVVTVVMSFTSKDVSMLSPAEYRLEVELPHRPVAFEVIWPRGLARDRWSTLFVTMHSGAAAGADLQEELDRRLGPESGYATRGAETALEHGAEITIVPEADGVTFNPPVVRLRWLEPWHIVELRMKVTSARRSVIGGVSFFVGPLLVAEVPIEIVVRSSEPDEGMRRSTATPYRSVFVSYAHADSAIVDQLEKAYRAIGDSYLRDVSLLRSGEVWSPALLDAIARADVFQLCWSDQARTSEHVDAEWRSALALRRPQFIRPVYWKKPLPPPPAELANLHFTYVPLEG